MGDRQKIQNRMLRSIRYFPSHTRIIEIHAYFKIQLLQNRTAEILKKYTMEKLNNTLISNELAFFQDCIEKSELVDFVVLDHVDDTAGLHAEQICSVGTR